MERGYIQRLQLLGNKRTRQQVLSCAGALFLKDIAEVFCRDPLAFIQGKIRIESHMGVRTTSSRPTKGHFKVFSLVSSLSTSRPAPKTLPVFKASSRASSSIISPRETFTMMGFFFIMATSSSSLWILPGNTRRLSSRCFH